MDEEKIKAIHRSTLYGVLTECGCGSCISSALYEVEGASNTIYFTKQPYHKDVQREWYEGIEKYRSVSYEFVDTILTKEMYELIELKNVNFTFATSFQLQGEGQSSLTHGWIGFMEFDKEQTYKREIYHVSIPAFHSRKEYFELIANIGIDLLYSKVNKDFAFTSPYIDNVVVLSGLYGELVNHKKEGELRTLEILNAIDPNGENFIVFREHDDGIARFEDFCRGTPGIILMKGSFNPLHEGHLKIFYESINSYSPDRKWETAFHISIGNRDKNDVNIDDLYKRIKVITQLGFNVIVSKQARFTDNLAWIRQRWKLPVIFPVGYDTINRFANDAVNTEIELHSELMDIHNSFHKEEKPNLSTDDIMKTSAFHFFTKEIWKDAKFLVFHRKDMELNEYTKYFSDLIQIENTYTDELGISSTKIRNGEWESKI